MAVGLDSLNKNARLRRLSFCNVLIASTFDSTPCLSVCNLPCVDRTLISFSAVQWALPISHNISWGNFRVRPRKWRNLTERTAINFCASPVSSHLNFVKFKWELSISSQNYLELCFIYSHRQTCVHVHYINKLCYHSSFLPYTLSYGHASTTCNSALFISGWRMFHSLQTCAKP